MELFESDEGESEEDRDYEESEVGLGIEDLDDVGLQAISLQVLSCPTVRGHNGFYDFQNNWLVTGSGTQKQLIQQWGESGVYPNDWLKSLGEEFLEDILEFKRWHWYKCPGCSSRI